jgi:hypothetical protein
LSQLRELRTKAKKNREDEEHIRKMETVVGLLERTIEDLTSGAGADIGTTQQGIHALKLAVEVVEWSEGAAAAVDQTRGNLFSFCVPEKASKRVTRLGRFFVHFFRGKFRGKFSPQKC